MSKPNDTSKVAALCPLADSELDALTGGVAYQTVQIVTDNKDPEGKYR